MSTPAQLLTFRTRGRWYACDLLWVREILRQPALTPVDRAPPDVRGLIHLRGQILTALDLDTRLGFGPSTTEHPSNRCIVFKTTTEISRLAQPPADSDLCCEDLLGLIVDEIGDILHGTDTLLPAPADTLSSLRREFISGVIPKPDGLITLLKVGALLSASETAHA